MTRHGPLTAQGLGRSPYDDVFPGTGSRYPPGPIQQYDERGRPINPETRRINRNVVRSHNEVMQVIGVAEPDTNTQQTELDALRKRHDDHEDEIGRTLLIAGQIVYYTAICASNGIRQRNLLYKRYQTLSLVDIFTFERGQRSIFTTLFAGYPAWASVLYLQIRRPLAENFGSRPLLYQIGVGWLQVHLSAFGLLQQVGVIPASQILPSWQFFIPFVPGSLIATPPLPTSLSTNEVLRFLGELALNTAPVLVFILHRKFSSITKAVVGEMMHRLLPRPISPSAKARPGRPIPSRTTTVPPAPEEIDLASSTEDAMPLLGSTPQGFVHGESADVSQTENGTQSRRPSIISANNTTTAATQTSEPTADALYASDDEENTGAELVSRTLISFDVETADTSDPPQSGWSAELRANVADSSDPQPQQQQQNDHDHDHDHHPHEPHHHPNPNPTPERQPVYRYNALTRTPAIIAAELFASSLVKIMLMPFDAPVHRWLARSFLSSRGMSTAGMYGVTDLLPWRAFGNFLGIELVHFLVQTDLWMVFYQIASVYMCSEEEWKETEDRRAVVDFVER